MRLLVCGSRDYTDAETLFARLDAFAAEHQVELVIEGEARGADTLAREWAELRGIPVAKFPADWKRFGRAAGPIRNRQMLVDGKPDHVIAFPASEARGTWDMVRQAREVGVPVTLY